jgi:hypothetical protein
MPEGGTTRVDPEAKSNASSGSQEHEKAGRERESKHAVSESERSMADFSIQETIRHKQRRRTGALVCVGLATVWTLYLHYRLVSESKPEPTRTELASPSAVDDRPSGGNPGSTTMSPVSGQTPIPGKTATSPSVPGTDRIIMTSSWVQVTHTSILLLSCVVMFVILVWAAVSLNREDN